MFYEVLCFTVTVGLVAAKFDIFKDDLAEPPQPYTFGYKVHGKDGDQWRSEKSNGHGKVEGSYGYVDTDGMQREVRYVADEAGFRAKVKTNEPGMNVPNPAHVIMEASGPYEYEAKVYGVEAIPRHLMSGDAKGYYTYRQFAEQSIPPVYVVDGHLQTPWFPMESVSVA